MNILLLLIPISLLMLGAAVGAFVWAVRRGQFDDLDTPALDILDDHDRPAPPRARSAHDPAAPAPAPHAPSPHDPAAPDRAPQPPHEG